MAKYDSDRLRQYVERFFSRSARTEWPTVRTAARSLGWRFDRVVDAVEGDPENQLFLSSYFVTPEPAQGDCFVEAS